MAFGTQRVAVTRARSVNACSGTAATREFVEVLLVEIECGLRRISIGERLSRVACKAQSETAESYGVADGAGPDHQFGADQLQLGFVVVV